MLNFNVGINIYQHLKERVKGSCCRWVRKDDQAVHGNEIFCWPLVYFQDHFKEVCRSTAVTKGFSGNSSDYVSCCSLMQEGEDETCQILWHSHADLASCQCSLQDITIRRCPIFMCLCFKQTCTLIIANSNSCHHILFTLVQSIRPPSVSVSLCGYFLVEELWEV